MQRRQLEAGDADPGGGAKRSRLTAACYALAVRLGCAAREPRRGGAANEKGSGKWSPRPTDSCRLEGGRKGGKGGGGEGEEVNETPPYLSATPRAAAPQVGGVGAAPPRFTPSTLRKQVCGARRHAIHTCRPNKRRLTIASCSHMPSITSHAAGDGRPSEFRRADQRRRGPRRRGRRQRERADTIHRWLEPRAAVHAAAVAAHHAITRERRGVGRDIAVAAGKWRGDRSLQGTG